MRIQKTKLEGLMIKYFEELSRAYYITRTKAETLQQYLIKYSSIISDPNLSIEQKANKTNLTKRDISVCRYPLLREGFAKYVRPSPDSDKVRSYITGNPSTIDEIGEAMGKSKGATYRIVKKLERKHEALITVMELGRRCVNQPFHPDELIGKAARKTFARRPGEDRLFGKRLIKDFPKKYTMKMRKSAVPRLKRILPPDSFDEAYRYIAEHTVPEIANILEINK
jgi:hypothetical protein